MNAEIAARLARVEGRVAAARARMDGGGHFDLEGLDADVAALRDAISALPPAQAREAVPRLVALLDEVNRLSGSMRTALDGLADQLGQSHRRRQALSAYGKPAEDPGRSRR